MFLEIRHTGIRNETSSATYYTNATITGQQHVGKPVSLDPTANFTVGLAADGADILGYLESFEDRKQEGIKVGAVCPQIYANFEYSGADPVIGQWVVGDGTGKVKASAARARALVTAVDTANKMVSVTFM